MTSTLAYPANEQGSPLARLLAAPRFEVMPVRSVEDEVAALPSGATVTVTCSPRHGIDRTVEVSQLLAARGYGVVPHLAARMVRDRDHLEQIVERLHAADLREAFVIGGDHSPPAGRYSDAGDLLEELDSLTHAPSRIGVGGYPEGHPFISDERLLGALRRKQSNAHYITTQICFDADALVRWIHSIREAGIDRAVIVGLPGAVDRRRLAEISARVGVGTSLRYLAKHARQIATLARARTYDPTVLARDIAAHLAEQDLGIQGVHLFTFNQVGATLDWYERAVSARP